MKIIINGLTTALIFVGFISGSFIYGLPSTTCCGADGICCCEPEGTSPDNRQSNNLESRCGCGMSEAAATNYKHENAKIELNTSENIEIYFDRTHPIESNIQLISRDFTQLQGVQITGPPIFIIISSLLI